MKMFPPRAENRITSLPPDARESFGDVALATRSQIKKPPMYKVLLLNDDYTPMEFVTFLLEKIFRKTAEEALRITMLVHKKGTGLCGVYSHEVAETKVDLTIKAARAQGHPLRCVMEKE